MNRFKPKSHSFKVIKSIQAGLIFIALLIYILLLISYETFRTVIFGSSLATAATIMLWGFFLINFIFIIMDLTVFHKVLKESDEVLKYTYLDDLTGIPNRYSCDLVFQMYAEPDKLNHVACALIVIDNLITINEVLGRDAGNQVIVDFSNILEEIGSDYGFVGRNGGNEFLLVMENGSEGQMKSFFEQLNIRLKRYNALDLNTPIEIYYKYVLNDDLHAEHFSDIIAEAYHLVHERD